MSQSRGLFSILCLFLAYSSAQAWNFGHDDGDRIAEKGFPWVVNVMDSCNNILGGGSLISNYAVLTAWKVVEGRNASQTKVHLGEWDNGSENGTAPLEVRVRSIARHPDFNETSGAYNLALLFLRSTVATTSTIRPINLATRASVRNLDLNSCIAKGLFRSTLPLAVMQPATCQQELRRWLGPSFQLDDSLMCAGGGIGRNICEDGYPLVCPLATDPTQFQQVGIVNWHINCGQGATPDVYTNVVQLVDWINQQIRLNPYVEGPATEDIEEQPQCEDFGSPTFEQNEQNWY